MDKLVIVVFVFFDYIYNILVFFLSVIDKLIDLRNIKVKMYRFRF